MVEGGWVGRREVVRKETVAGKPTASAAVLGRGPHLDLRTLLVRYLKMAVYLFAEALAPVGVSDGAGRFSTLLYGRGERTGDMRCACLSDAIFMRYILVPVGNYYV
jgi:hypothetical protein